MDSGRLERIYRDYIACLNARDWDALGRFVDGADKSHEPRTIVKSVIDLAHDLGLTATAEGVETQAVLDLLRHLGCDQAQGYFIARPMPGDELADWLAQRDRNTAA